MSVYVGIDVHRNRSQVAVIDAGGKVLANRNVSNGVKPVLSVIGGLPAGTPAAYEAAFGWGWLLKLLEGYGFEPHMVHPLQCKAIASARLKNDKVDAATLAQLLRADLLPEARVAPPQVRQLRALLRHRAQLVRLRTLLRNWIHAALADHGHGRPAGCWSGPGRAWLVSLELPAVPREVIDDGLALMDAPQQPIDRLDAEVRQRAKADPRVKVFLFTREFAVSWTNNVSERGAKAAKRHQAVSGYWHSPATLARWCRLRSYLDTAAAHVVTALDAIRAAIEGKPWLPPLPAIG
jgi:transposase